METIEQLQKMVKIRDRMIANLLKERQQTEEFRRHHAAMENELLEARRENAQLKSGKGRQ